MTEPDTTPSGTGTDDRQPPTDDKEALLEEVERRRSLRGVAAVAVSLIGIAFSLFQLWLAESGQRFDISIPIVGIEAKLLSLQSLQINAIHVSFALILAFLIFPTSTGDGFLSRRLGRLQPFVRDRLGQSHPVSRLLERVADGVRWFFLDPERNRVTPLDLLLIGSATLAPIYMAFEWSEVRSLRVRGFDTIGTVDEVYPFLELPVGLLSAVGIPLDSVAYGFIVGVLGILLVLEATRRALGVYLMAIVSSFIVYARWGYLIPRDGEVALRIVLGPIAIVPPEVTLPYIGVLSITQTQWTSIVRDLWFTTEGIFGVPVAVSVDYIYIFVLFGAFLEMSGAGKWFIELAYSLTGKRKGGPAKASIIASGFMGMISGSSVANTVTTGAFTIPLMKRSGYDSEFSGGVEAAASSGGQIMPPVMGAAAFLIVEYTGTPYAEVIIAAAVPAFLFFFGVWIMVHLKASKEGIGGLNPGDIVDFRPHLRLGWFYLLPIVILLYFLLIERLSVDRSAWLTIVGIVGLLAVITAYDERTAPALFGTIGGLFALSGASYLLVGGGITTLIDTLVSGGGFGGGLPPGEAVSAALPSWIWITLWVGLSFSAFNYRGSSPLLDLDPQVDATLGTIVDRLSLPDLTGNRMARFGTFVFKSMDSGARTATEVVVAVAAAGIIPGVITVTGLGPNLTSLLRVVAGDSLVLLLVITAFACIILGMGMPTTVTYIILVSMLGPALEGFGLAILAAHLFILYFGVIADITPPVAVAAYAASGIAKSDQFVTGVKAFSLSLNKALVPFAFVFAPGILLVRGSGEESAVIGLADVLDIGFFIPEVLVPILALTVGVAALGPSVIGYLYAPLDRIERASFGVASLALSAPLLVHGIIQGLLGLAGLQLGVDTLTFDLVLRGLGLVLFVALVVSNRRASRHEPKATPGAA